MLTINFSSVNVRGVVGDLFSRNFHLQIGREERGVPLHPKAKMPDGRRQRKKIRLMDCEVSQQRWIRTRRTIFEMLNTKIHQQYKQSEPRIRMQSITKTEIREE